MIPGRRVPEEARRAYRLDRLSSLLAGLYMGAIFPFAGVLARGQLHASAYILALMTAAPFVGNLGALFWARAMEGRPKLPFVQWSQFAARATFLLAVFATTPLRFALILSAAQIFGTIATPAYAAVIKEVYPDDQRGRIMSYTRATLYVAMVVTTFLVGPLLKHVSYRFVFPAACLCGLAAALVFGRIPVAAVSSLPGESPARASLGEACRETLRFLTDTMGIFRADYGYRWFALSIFTYGFGNLLIQPAIPMIQVDRLHVTTQEIAWLATLAQITAALAYFFWGRYVDRHSPQKAVVCNTLMNGMIAVIYLMANNIWMLVPAFLLGGITQAGIDLSYFNTVLTFAGEESTSRYQALHSFLQGVRGIIGPVLGGLMIQMLRNNGLDLRWVFVPSLALILIGCGMQLVGIRRRGPEPAREVAYT